MKIFIDVNDGYKCHVADSKGTMLEYEERYFDGKCPEFIEGFRCKPDGCLWQGEDGTVYGGAKMICAWKDYGQLYTAQLEYELALAKAEREDMLAALKKLGVDEDA